VLEALNGQEARSYRSVVATPVCQGKTAYGAITADSKSRRVFRNKEALIDQILRPYAAAILLTLPADAPSFPCPERYEA